jgi:SAM-dependent methyltransferase
MFDRLKHWIVRKTRTASGFLELQAQIQNIQSQLQHAERQRMEFDRQAELRYRDLILLLSGQSEGMKAKVRVITDHPIARESDDHKHPWGTANDNTRNPRFVEACRRHFQRNLRYLDLGCAGGGLVLDFLLQGHFAVGLEGSDISLRGQRAEWRVLPHNLFTCDITKPLAVCNAANEKPIVFDVITAWEVMEHIKEADLAVLFANVRKHLAPDGLFVGSIATTKDENPQTGAVYHQTVKPQPWWRSRFEQNGLAFLERHPFAFGDFCRGTGVICYDPNFMLDPSLGFHFVAAHGTKRGKYT